MPVENPFARLVFVHESSCFYGRAEPIPFKEQGVFGLEGIS
jgi:hypothetical protein